MEGWQDMCGRYYVASDLYDEIKKFIHRANRGMPTAGNAAGSAFDVEFSGELAGWDILPSTASVIIYDECGRDGDDNPAARRLGVPGRFDTQDGRDASGRRDLCSKAHALTAAQMHFGFPGPRGKGLLINARAETVLERPTFSRSMLTQRCLVPASRYYEWNSQKEKVTFRREGHSVFYMAGIYRIDNGKRYFAILTTEANASVRPVHHRMPLILDEEEAQSWLLDQEAAIRLLHKVPFPMSHEQEYEQLDLFSL